MDENLNNEELLDSENFEEQEDLEVETDENGLTETFGDENYENFIMPDGTMNFRYIEKLNVLQEQSLPEFLSFSSFPSILKKDILIKGGSGFAFILISLLLFILNIFPFKAIITFILIGLLLLFSAFIRYRVCKSNNIVKFEGLTVHVENMGLLKINKYQVVKISNSEKFLNVKLSYNKKMREGLPITVYINKYEPIIDSEYGPLVENILAFNLNVNTKEDQAKFEKENVSADEYINH